ncbi:EAL domain-containing protein [Alkalimarinus sediminis]|uniref:Diguanylate cyclase n=1 Tax=Alkalimarinus sediminis TaxID=1632866 RepID=A0A9E8KNT6_9ALTE|nr:diguanylate cyclase [Alkalimarinus sediminis]UZW74708.1 diguanylate cyclase [Alkalimarinus sediminis]
MNTMKKYEISRIRNDDDPDAHEKDSGQYASVIIDNANNIVQLCPLAERWFGYKNHDIIGQHFKTLAASTFDYPKPIQQQEMIQNERTVRVTFRHKTGYFFPGTITIKELTADHLELDQHPITPWSHTDSQVAQQLLGDTSLTEQFELAGKMGGWRFDVMSNQLSWSDGLYSIFAIDKDEEITPEHILYYFHEAQSRVQAAFRRCLTSGEPISLEAAILNADQQSVWVRITGKAHHVNGQITHLSGSIQDITELHNAKTEQSQLGDYLAGVLEGTEDLVLALDNDLRIITFNSAYQKQFKEIFGFTIKVGDMLPELLKSCPNERRIYQRLWERALERDNFCVEMPLAQREEDLPIYEVRFSRITNNRGDRLGAAHIARNITDRVKVQEKLNYLAKHDPLTGTFNRREFQSRLTRCLTNAQQRESTHALLYMDLDQFKEVNDCCGHSAGDELLRQISRIINDKIRQRDAFARIGGDEFAAILENCSTEEAQRVAENIREAISSYEFKYDDQYFKVGVSIGLVPITHESESTEQLIKIADSTCYAAKAAGRNRVHSYNSHKEKRRTELKQSKQQIQIIQKAIRGGDSLQLSYQQIRPVNSAVWGDYFEVLARIQDKEGNLFMPSQFIHIAQRFDIIRAFDQAVIYKVMQWLAQHNELEHRRKLCSINIAAESMLDPKLPAFIKRQLKQFGLEAETLCFELDERSVVERFEQAKAFAATINELGCKIAIDNVGKTSTGYQYLAEIPASYIKIDGGLIKSMHEDPIKQVIVESIQKIANLTGKQTIAGNVEDQGALGDIRRMGIHFGQGFGISKPKPLDEMVA